MLVKPKTMMRKKGKKSDEEEEAFEFSSPAEMFAAFQQDHSLEDRGIILINNMISKETLAAAYKKILALHFDDTFTDEIQVILNSPGGYNDGGWAFIDLLNFVNNPIRTIATGEICSMATMIFVAGDYRVMSPNSTAMIHQFSSGSEGTYGDLVASRKVEDMEHDKIVQHFVRNSKYKNGKQVVQSVLLDHDHWLSPSEMLEHGLCDEVLAIRPRNARRRRSKI